MSTTRIEWIDQQYLKVATAAAARAGASEKQAKDIALEVLAEHLEKQAVDTRIRAEHAEGPAYHRGIEHAREIEIRAQRLRSMRA